MCLCALYMRGTNSCTSSSRVMRAPRSLQTGGIWLGKRKDDRETRETNTPLLYDYTSTHIVMVYMRSELVPFLTIVCVSLP